MSHTAFFACNRRYYLNNFQDGAKQDAIDFATGNYTIKKGAPRLLLLCCVMSGCCGPWGSRCVSQVIESLLNCSGTGLCSGSMSGSPSDDQEC